MNAETVHNATGNFRIRRMTRKDVDIAVEWAAEEGWNPGLNDAECFYRTDPEGFFIGEVDGKPVGVVSAVAYGNDFGFLGFYIVRPEYRGRGFGMHLTAAALEYMGDRLMGLDGVISRLEDYKNTMKFHLAYRNVRFQGVGKKSQSGKSVVALSEIPFEELLAYDMRCFPVQRETFLRCWIQQPNAAALGVMLDDRLAGYGVIRKCREGYKVGPMFADNMNIAEDLFQALTHTAPNAPVFLDAPEANPAAVSLAEHHGMEPVFATGRMYNTKAPAIAMERVFGVTSFELG